MSATTTDTAMIDRTFLGRESERLSDLIAEQTAELFAREGVVIPVKSCSVMDALAQCAPASASDLASRLDRSHQIIMQKLPRLIELGLVERSPDPADRRRFLLEITDRGAEQLERLHDLSPRIATAYRAIEDDIGSVYDQIVAMIEQLAREPLVDRID